MRALSETDTSEGLSLGHGRNGQVILAGVIAHWDEVDGIRRDKPPMCATWQRLGDAAGAQGCGLNRVRIEPGRLSTPPHSHGRSEEIYYVLNGSGLLWQDAAVCAVRAGDTIVQVADHYEHTFKGGPDGLDYLVFGTRHPVEYGWLPRSRAIRLSYPSPMRTDASCPKP